MMIMTSGAGGAPDCAPFACQQDGCRLEQAAFDTSSSWITVTGPKTVSLTASPVPPMAVEFRVSDVSSGDPFTTLVQLTTPPWTVTFQPSVNGRVFLWASVAAYCGYNGHAILTMDVQQPGIPGDTFPRLRLVNPYFILDTAQQSASQCQARQVLAVADDDHASPIVQLFADGVQVAQTAADPALFQLTQMPSLLSVVAVDSAGQKMERTIPLTPDPGPCAPPPLVAIVAPRDGATVRGMVALTAMSTDPTRTVLFSLDDGTANGQLDLGQAAGPAFTTMWDSSGVPEGDYTMFVFFTDQTISTNDRIRVHVAR